VLRTRSSLVLLHRIFQSRTWCGTAMKQSCPVISILLILRGRFFTRTPTLGVRVYLFTRSPTHVGARVAKSAWNRFGLSVSEAIKTPAPSGKSASWRDNLRSAPVTYNWPPTTDNVRRLLFRGWSLVVGCWLPMLCIGACQSDNRSELRLFRIRPPKFCWAKLGRVETETPLLKRGFQTRKKGVRSGFPL